MMQFSENQMALLNERYLLDKSNGEKEAWEDLSMRVAVAIAKASLPYNDRNFENEVKEYYESILNFDFIPATPILMNAGTEKQQLFSCFVTQLQDSLESIYSELGLSARIFSGAGGVGYDFGQLRPEGSKVSGRGISSGALSFMKLYDTSCGIIKIGSGSRRGAMLAALPVDHPEILDFIKCKQNGKDFKNFNISVVITDEFMAAVKMDGEYELKSFKNNPERKTLKARKVFNAIVAQAWKTGEPGILFLDTANKFNPTPKLGKYISTNPCFTGNMLLKTTRGYKSFAELSDKNVDIINKDGNVEHSRVWCSGVKDVIRLNLSDGSKLECTPDHRLMLSDGTECLAKDSYRQCLKVYTSPYTLHDSLYVKLGFIQGDGNLTRLTSTEHNGLEINIGKNDKDVQNYFGYADTDFSKDGRKVYTDEFTKTLKELNFSALPLPERVFPSTFSNWLPTEQLSFLRGLFSANGCVVKNHRVSFKTTCKTLIEELVHALSGFGIESTYVTNKAKETMFSNGAYLCKESYDLQINKYTSIVKFYEEIGFLQAYKNKDLEALIQNNAPKVLKITNLPAQAVYDFTAPETHWGVVNGFVVHNCGEVVGIDGSVCCLGHVNFATIIKDGAIDYNELERRIRIGIRFLDNCIDVNKYPHDKFKKISFATRTIGLGFAGFADLLIQLKIRYGSQECFKLINEIGSFFQEISHDESLKIAEKRGVYPAFEGKTPLRRNASTNTIAPTGSTAMIADCSYGVEPYFALAFIKNCMDGKQLTYGNKYFEEYLLTLPIEIKENVLDYAIKHGTLKGIDKKMLPEYIIDIFVTAHDIEPRDRVKVQAAWQKYIDLSISSTVNLPENSTKEDVADIYRLSWDYGCKGITVYRNNSRSQQVLNIEKVKNTWTCEMCGHIEELPEGVNADATCIKCPKCNHKSCA